MTVQIRERIARHLLVEGPVFSFSGTAGTVLRGQCGFEGKAATFSRVVAAMEIDAEIHREVNVTRCYGIELTDAGRDKYQHLLAEGETLTLDRLDLAPVEVEAPVVVASLPEPEPDPSPRTPDPEPEPFPVACPADVVQLAYPQLVEAVRTLLRTEQKELTKNYVDVKTALASAREEANRWRLKAKAYEDQVHKLEQDKTELRNRLRNSDPKNDRVRVSEIQDMLDVASRTPGFRVERTNNGHYRVYGTKGAPVTVPGTPSSYRSAANTRSDLINIGLKV